MPRDWDQHYSDPARTDRAPILLLVELADRLRPGDALDLACGLGRHTLHLARLGWRVTAVDASPVAIARLTKCASGLPVRTVRADLERGEFQIAPDSYDLICDFFYLQRDLFPQIRQGIRLGGVFAGAIHLSGTFALKPGELRNEFDGWKIVYYSETEAASIIARKA